MEMQTKLRTIYEFETEKAYKFDVGKIFEEIRNGEDTSTVDALMAEFKHIINNEAGLAKLNIMGNLNSYFFNLQLQTRLNELVTCKVRVYVLDGYSFAQRDLYSLSDPYLILKCGKTKIDEQKHY